MENINDTADDESGPLEAAIKKERQALVRDAIQQIPQRYREPLVLYYRRQQSIKQVAFSLDLSEDVVRQRLHRGRKMIELYHNLPPYILVSNQGSIIPKP